MSESSKSVTKDNDNKKVYSIDFITTSSISKIGYKFLAFYIPILWFSGYITAAVFFDVSRYIPWYINIFLLPVWMFILYFIFLFGIAIITKAFMLIMNMVHLPKEGIFKAVEGDKDYEFWRVRVELKKLVLWFMSNGPLAWVVMWGFRWFGTNVDFSSHAHDAWLNGDFIKFGRNVTVGQGAVVMSSMIVGKYLIIKKVILGDHTVVGGMSNISPGTILGKESIVGAFSGTIPNQVIEPRWVYIGPHSVRKYKPNKYLTESRDIIYRKDVDEEIKYEHKQEINIEEEKKSLLENNSK